MKPHHYLVLVIVVFVGYMLGKKFPSALSGVPIIGSM